jgi:hypothetical protein
MTLFLLEFDRRTQRLVAPPDTFDEGHRVEAGQRRLAAQRRAIRQALDRDIVLLEADSEADLHRTHSSFFLTPEELGAELKTA